MNTLASFLALALVALQQPVLAVWPAPQHYSKGSSFLYIHQNIKITYNEEFVRWDSCPVAAGRATEDSHSPSAQMTFTSGYTPRSPTSKEIVQAGVSRALDSIFRTPFAPYALRKHGNLTGFEPDVYAGQTWVDTLQITQLAADKPSAFRPRAGDVDESYNLTISADGHTKLSAVSSIGVLRGLETFSQLFYQHTTGTFWYTPHAPVAIRDAPRFPHRGVLLDTSRHFFSVDDLKRTIDAMSWNKLNRLHVHVTDSQSWPLDVPSMPELARMGAYNPRSIYSAADLEAVQQYGQHRGVEVYLEIDMPGHIGSVAESHPELIVAYDAQPYYWYCAQPPCGAFKLSNPDVDRFLGRLFDDVLPRVAPYSAYFHTGGDELNTNDSMLDEGIRSNDTRVLQPLLQRFIDRQHGRVRAAGLTPLSWEEIPLEWNVTVGADTVIQTWLGAESVKKVTAKGLQVIDSNYNFWVRPLPTPLLSTTNTSLSTSTAAAASGSPLTTAPPSSSTTPSTTGAARPRAGRSSTRTTPRPASRPRRPSSCWAARWRCGASRSTRRRSTPSSGRAPAPPARCSGPAARTPAGATGARSTRCRGCSSFASAWWRGGCAPRRLRSSGARRRMTIVGGRVS